MTGSLEGSFEPNLRGLLKNLSRTGPLPTSFGGGEPLGRLSKPEGISPQTWRSFTKGTADRATRRKVERRMG